MADTIHPKTARPDEAAGVDDRPVAMKPDTDAHPVWTATGHERPVFLDERGRRRRWVLAGGASAGLAGTLWLLGVLAGAVGFTDLPLPHPHAGPSLARIALAAEAPRNHRTLAARDLDPRASGPVHLVVLPAHLRAHGGRS